MADEYTPPDESNDDWMSRLTSGLVDPFTPIKVDLPGIDSVASKSVADLPSLFESEGNWLKDGYRNLDEYGKKFAWQALGTFLTSMATSGARKAQEDYYKTVAKTNADRLALDQEKQANAASSAGKAFQQLGGSGLINSNFVNIKKTPINKMVGG